MTVDTVADAWRPGISCLVITHLFGQVVDSQEILDFAHQRGTLVIEDCAHALGSIFHGNSVGLQGDGAIFSFDYLKPLNTFGGGMAIAKDPQVIEKIENVTNHTPISAAGVLKKFFTGIGEDLLFAGSWLPIPTGLLALEQTQPIMEYLDKIIRRHSLPKVDTFTRLSNLQSAVGLEQLKTLEARMRTRRKVAGRILEALELEAPQMEETSSIRQNAYFVVVRAAPNFEAKKLRQKLWLKGIDSGINTEVADYLPGVLGQSPQPNAYNWYSSAIQLPGFETLTLGQQERLCRKLYAFRGKMI